ncbi:aldose epimerase [Cohnella faecalis]|uniref:Aldose epimerase n=1 Tax=Cohnella faecalis TaxID=2315694 RepID=A0A398CTA8_9BACL|nr:aldose epimerase [Cohnella faecalis]RIE02194.1 aldose epimerase [Cohnella faecalis]
MTNADYSNYSIAVETDGFPIYRLTDRSTDSLVSVCPERGAIVIGCRLNGQELFYLDRATFLDPQANIRGGNPVLFPICGQLIGGQYEWEGQTYGMKNHGVARINPWEVEASGATEDSAYVTVVLRSDEKTLSAYPFDFELRFTYRLKNGVLSIEQNYSNLSDKPMPMVAGFHPYFAAEGKNLPYATDATKYLDYNDNVVKPLADTVDLNGLVESVALLDPVKPEISFPLNGERRVRLSYSEQFRNVVLWSVEGKPFVCVEPWTALNEALNSKEGLLLVGPGESLALELSFACEAND